MLSSAKFVKVKYLPKTPYFYHSSILVIIEVK